MNICIWIHFHNCISCCTKHATSTTSCQRLFGVGTVCVHSSDKSIPHLDLKNVKNPREVKELIHQNVEEAKDRRRMRATELLDGDGLDGDDGCGID